MRESFKNTVNMFSVNCLQKISGFKFFLLCLPVLAGFALWFCQQSHYGINTNSTWLTIAALRLLSGEAMSEAYYDTNPPLSILLYLPSAVLVKYLSVPLKYSVFYYTLILAFLSFIVSAKLLSGTLHNFKYDRLVFWICFVICSLLLPGYYFGEREHIITLAFVPFALAFLFDEKSAKLPRPLIIATITAGTIVAMVKPPLVIFPIFFILYEIVRQKKLQAAFTYKPLTIMLAGLSYPVLLWLFFRDYLEEILPDMTAFYISFLWNYDLKILILEFCMITAAAAVLVVTLPGPRKKLPLMLLAGCLVFILNIAAQGKGFYYHFLPLLIFFSCAVSLAILQIFKNQKIGLIMAVLFSLFFAWGSHKDYYSRFLYPFVYNQDLKNAAYKWPTHVELEKSVINKAVARYAPGGSYFILASMPMLTVPAAYNEAVFASRFPSFWFLPALIQAEQEQKLLEDQLLQYQKKYTSMVRADFIKFQPDVVILGDLAFFKDQKEGFNFIKYFSADPEFKRLWQDYRKVETLRINSRDYYGGYIYGNQDEIGYYDVYVRENNFTQP